MKQLLPVFGDIGLGILTILCVNHFYDTMNYYSFFLLFFAIIPDLDAVPEVMKRGKVAASADNPSDHREILHKPLIWLSILGVAWYMFDLYGAIAFFLVFVHFLHGTVLTGWGVPWLTPFSDRRIKFFVDEENEVSLSRNNWLRTWNQEELQKAIVKYGNENWIEDLYLKPSVVSVVEYGTFLISLIALCLELSGP